MSVFPYCAGGLDAGEFGGREARALSAPDGPQFCVSLFFGGRDGGSGQQGGSRGGGWLVAALLSFSSGAGFEGVGFARFATIAASG